MSRPICACCGKPYGRRATREERLLVEIGQPVPTYRGNHMLIREEINPPLPPNGEPDVPRGSFTPMDPWPEWLGKGLVEYTGRKGGQIIRTTWDGESYITPHKPFCTLRCAEVFAHAAYRAGYRIKRNG